jgi:hypothetical protein
MVASAPVHFAISFQKPLGRHGRICSKYHLGIHVFDVG